MEVYNYKLRYDKENYENFLVREDVKKYHKKISSPETIYDFMRYTFCIDQESEEYMYLLCFDNRLNPIGVFELSHGTLNASMTDPRSIFTRALLCNAASIVLVHNHPSGEVTPSAEDKKITAKISEAGKLMGVELLDHIIIGDYYMSFKNEGLF